MNQLSGNVIPVHRSLDPRNAWQYGALPTSYVPYQPCASNFVNYQIKSLPLQINEIPQTKSISFVSKRVEHHKSSIFMEFEQKYNEIDRELDRLSRDNNEMKHQIQQMNLKMEEFIQRMNGLNVVSPTCNGIGSV